ncbi:MAG: hypothetical protein JO033_25850 [Acidobacteriaceae bacterium]|nr:hypothetical protein [Acidobacteriaceae bacterium]MBV9501963.1 hypothetical protein [Acidobacteriaceae bacterium]
MPRLTAKSSTIFIATGEETRVYRSVEDVPPPLRRKLVESTRGLNSATILIADKRGREELVRALQGRASEVQSRLADTIRSREQQQQNRVEHHRLSFASGKIWLEVLLSAAAAASLFGLYYFHY